MGLMDMFKGSANKQAEPDVPEDVQSAVAEEIAEESGGLAGLLERFKAGGLDDAVKSWVGKGENAKINADQLKSVFSKERLQAIGDKLGVTADEAARKVADVLPTVVDKLTPDGLVPDAKAVADKVTGFIKKAF